MAASAIALEPHVINWRWISFVVKQIKFYSQFHFLVMNSSSYPFYRSSLFARTKQPNRARLTHTFAKNTQCAVFFVVAMVMNTTNKVIGLLKFCVAGLWWSDLLRERMRRNTKTPVWNPYFEYHSFFSPFIIISLFVNIFCAFSDYLPIKKYRI